MFASINSFKFITNGNFKIKSHYEVENKNDISFFELEQLPADEEKIILEPVKNLDSIFDSIYGCSGLEEDPKEISEKKDLVEDN